MGVVGQKRNTVSIKHKGNIIDSVLVQCFAESNLLINACGRIFYHNAKLKSNTKFINVFYILIHLNFNKISNWEDELFISFIIYDL